MSQQAQMLKKNYSNCAAARAGTVSVAEECNEARRRRANRIASEAAKANRIEELAVASSDRCSSRRA
jgi:hypothetical protein